jgi:type VI secretion system protein ImpF
LLRGGRKKQGPPAAFAAENLPGSLMNHDELDQGLLPSLLDRLTDPASAGTAGRPGYSLERYEQSVLSDLEELLNTRRLFDDLPEHLENAHQSILNYGRPDFSTLSQATGGMSQDESADLRRRVGEQIQRTIELFEPRLCDVTVTVLDKPGGAGGPRDSWGKLHYRIDARLRVEPVSDEPTPFTSVLELVADRCSVKPHES